LIEIRSANSNLGDPHKAAIQTTLGHIRKIEEIIEESLVSGSEPKEAVPRMNKILSLQIEKLNTVLVELKSNQSG